jgi:nicotinamide-nucleotide amidase
VLSVGNELLLGNTVNTNATWLAAQITSLGGTVTRITVVRDKQGDISKAVREGIRRKPDFIITTGGIGPTFDDMTINGIAQAFHLRLKLDKTALEMVREHYARRFPHRRIFLTRPRLKMALIPSGGSPIQNPVGTAPAVRLIIRRTQIFCLPGVPREAKAIFLDSISAAIRSRAGRRFFAERWLKVQGVMESAISPIIDQVMSRCPGVYIKSHPRGFEGGNRPNIELHFSILTSDPDRAGELLTNAIGSMKVKLRLLRAKTVQLKHSSTRSGI